MPEEPVPKPPSFFSFLLEHRFVPFVLHCLCTAMGTMQTFMAVREAWPGPNDWRFSLLLENLWNGKPGLVRQFSFLDFMIGVGMMMAPLYLMLRQSHMDSRGISQDKGK